MHVNQCTFPSRNIHTFIFTDSNYVGYYQLQLLSYCLSRFQLSVVLTDALEAENVRVIAGKLTLDAGDHDPAIVVQQLNVGFS